MLALPLRRPQPLDLIEQGALAVDQSRLTSLSTFQARNGIWLAYRYYHSTQDESNKTILIVHGSSAQLIQMTELANALAASGLTAIVLDIRGHGASGQRGDIAYIRQLNYDLEDLLIELRRTDPNQKFILVGTSLGGGFFTHISTTAVGQAFERFILLAPFLGPSTPTSGASNKAWASVNLPRIIGITIRSQFKVTLGQSLPVIAFANGAKTKRYVTSLYSYRLLFSFGPYFNWKKTITALAQSAKKYL